MGPRFAEPVEARENMLNRSGQHGLLQRAFRTWNPLGKVAVGGGTPAGNVIEQIEDDVPLFLLVELVK